MWKGSALTLEVLLADVQLGRRTHSSSPLCSGKQHTQSLPQVLQCSVWRVWPWPAEPYWGTGHLKAKGRVERCLRDALNRSCTVKYIIGKCRDGIACRSQDILYHISFFPFCLGKTNVNVSVASVIWSFKGYLCLHANAHNYDSVGCGLWSVCLPVAYLRVRL